MCVARVSFIFDVIAFQSANKTQGLKDMAALALSQRLPIPGEADFPLNSMYKAPTNKQDEGSFD